MPIHGPLIRLAAAVLAAVEPGAEPQEAKTSLQTETAEESWAQAGFRVGLSYQLEGLLSEGSAPSGPVHAVSLRAGVRLDERWSLFAAFRYGVLPQAPPGLRYSGTVEPTLHLGDFTLAVGAGVAGFVFADTNFPTPEPDGGIIATYTLPRSEPLLGSCLGAGVIGLARVEYSWILGTLLSTGPSLQVDLQWTGCTQPLSRSDPDTGESIVLRQFWRHGSVSLGWSFWWR